MLAEIMSFIENSEVEKMTWFNSFGDCLRSVIVNAHDDSKRLEFG